MKINKETKKDIFSQLVKEKREWIGGMLEDVEACSLFPDCSSYPTRITDIRIESGSHGDYFEVEGEKYRCGFDTGHGGVVDQDKRCITFYGYGGHRWRIRRPKGISNEGLENLAERFNSGESGVFPQIQKEMNSIVESILRRNSYLPDHRDDVRQELWLNVVKKLKFWNKSRGSIKSFLYTCLNNCYIDYIRQHASNDFNRSLSEIDDDISSENKNDNHELNVTIPNRLSDPLSSYVMNRVCTAVYLGTFSRRRNTLTKSLCDISKMKKRYINFLVNYSLVTLRKHFMEGR